MLSQILFPLAKRFVSGHTIGEAVEAVRQLNAQGITATLDVLGENVTERKTAEAAVSSYLQTLDAIGQSNIRANVSLKLTQMGLDIDRDFCLANLVRICERASALPCFVRIDMEGSNYTQKTLDLFYDLFRKQRNVGIVIQAYLHRSLKDIQQLIDLGGRVRLCKGAYKEPPALAFQEMPEIRRILSNCLKPCSSKGIIPPSPRTMMNSLPGSSHLRLVTALARRSLNSRCSTVFVPTHNVS